MPLLTVLSPRARSLDQFKPMEGVGVIMAAMEVYHPMGSYSPSRKMTKRGKLGPEMSLHEEVAFTQDFRPDENDFMEFR